MLLTYKGIDNQTESSNSYKRLEMIIGDLKPQDSIEISFEVLVKRGASGEKLTNTANIFGKDLRGEPLENSSSVINPGGEVKGQLSLVSVPDNIDFGTKVKLQDYNKVVNITKKDFGSQTGLTVEDTRAIQKKWKLGAQIIEEMTLQKSSKNFSENSSENQLKNGFSYVYNGKSLPLSIKEMTIIFDSQDQGNKVKQDQTNLYRLSDIWGTKFNSTSLLTDGLKFKSDVIPNEGTYRGVIEWQVQDTITD